ncbi:hypothetical protein [Chryseobacterium arthrosphaerae]|uniref:hypothetical protein n=1 Tax=Chryseobacterium arthrosphaerae TaxID=651561 RepID=UPI0031DA8852
MKYIVLSALFLFSCKEKETRKNPEKKDSATVAKAPEAVLPHDTDILKILVDEEAETEKGARPDYKDYSVSFSNDGDSYTVSFQKIASDDFNNDGITDYIVERDSEGMLGGNANTNSEVMYIIMGKNSTISEKHEILMYAPFSYNILDGISYEGGKLKASAVQNYRAYSVPEDSLQSAQLSFVYKDGNVYEESYLTGCELGKWKNKKIFKSASEHYRSIDRHNYTETVNEKYHSDGFEASAELSGCDNMNVVFEGTYKTADTGIKSIGEKRKQFLDFLLKNTTLQKEIAVVHNHYLTHQPSGSYTDVGNLSFNIFTDKKKGEINFRLVITKENNPKQNENWDIVTRIK